MIWMWLPRWRTASSAGPASSGIDPAMASSPHRRRPMRHPAATSTGDLTTVTAQTGLLPCDDVAALSRVLPGRQGTVFSPTLAPPTHTRGASLLPRRSVVTAALRDFAPRPRQQRVNLTCRAQIASVCRPMRHGCLRSRACTGQGEDNGATNGRALGNQAQGRRRGRPGEQVSRSHGRVVARRSRGEAPDYLSHRNTWSGRTATRRCINLISSSVVIKRTPAHRAPRLWADPLTGEDAAPRIEELGTADRSATAAGTLRPSTGTRPSAPGGRASAGRGARADEPQRHRRRAGAGRNDPPTTRADGRAGCAPRRDTGLHSSWRVALDARSERSRLRRRRRTRTAPLVPWRAEASAGAGLAYDATGVATHRRLMVCRCNPAGLRISRR